jgi:hypothetical protein
MVFPPFAATKVRSRGMHSEHQPRLIQVPVSGTLLPDLLASMAARATEIALAALLAGLYCMMPRCAERA